MKDGKGSNDEKSDLTANFLSPPVITAFELPSNFKTWGEAIQEVVSARNEGVVPDQVAPATWKIFETIAFLLIPKVNG